MIPNGPNRFWVADLTDVAVSGGFTYVAVTLDAWSRRAIGRSVNARRAPAGLAAAIADRAPPPGCVYLFDRGSQYAAEAYRERLAVQGLVAAMSPP